MKDFLTIRIEHDKSHRTKYSVPPGYCPMCKKDVEKLGMKSYAKFEEEAPDPADRTPDLSLSFNPVPKVYKEKKKPKGLNPIGKKGQNSLDAVAQLKVVFQKYGITTCELMYEGCWKDSALTFAHVDKRINLTPEDVRNPNKVVLACTPCHQIVEQMPRLEMREILEKIIEAREWK